MADLIDRAAFIKSLCNQCDGWCDKVDCNCLNCKCEHRCNLIQELAEFPTADAVEVVQCKDCKKNPRFERKGKRTVWCRQWRSEVRETDFCSYGERRAADG